MPESAGRRTRGSMAHPPRNSLSPVGLEATKVGSSRGPHTSGPVCVCTPMKEESSLRKALIGVLTGALFFAAVGVAIALTNNTVNYTSTLTQKGKAKPAGTNTGYEGILSVGTTDGKQPNVAPLTEVYFAKGLKNNGPKFKSCSQKDIESPQSNKNPAKCKKAIVGGGTADASVGTPGSNQTPQYLSVVALNGKKG